MPDDDDYADDDLDQEDESPVIRTLRQKLKKAEAQAAQVGPLQTENALLNAGLGGLSDKQRKALIATHEGEMTPEALKAAAAELGFPIATEAEPEPEVPAEAQDALERMQQATSGAQPSEGQELTLDDRIKAAKSPQELEAIMREADLLATGDV